MTTCELPTCRPPLHRTDASGEIADARRRSRTAPLQAACFAGLLVLSSAFFGCASTDVKSGITSVDSSPKPSEKNPPPPPPPPKMVDGDLLIPVVTSGRGVSPAAALDVAYKKAVESALGVLVGADVSVSERDDLNMSVITASNGCIHRAEVLEERREDGLHVVSVRAFVRSGRLLDRMRLADASKYGDVDGPSLYAKSVTEQSARDGMTKLVVRNLSAFPSYLLQTSIVTSPSVVDSFGDRTRLLVVAEIRVDQAAYTELEMSIRTALEYCASLEEEFCIDYDNVVDDWKRRPNRVYEDADRHATEFMSSLFAVSPRSTWHPSTRTRHGSTIVVTAQDGGARWRCRRYARLPSAITAALRSLRFDWRYALELIDEHGSVVCAAIGSLGEHRAAGATLVETDATERAHRAVAGRFLDRVPEGINYLYVASPWVAEFERNTPWVCRSTPAGQGTTDVWIAPAFVKSSVGGVPVAQAPRISLPLYVSVRTIDLPRIKRAMLRVVP